MEIRIIHIICILMLIIVGCEKDDFTTGIVGIVEYGHADCMPSPDGPKVTFDKYNGVLYFINKRAFENLGNGNLTELKEVSIKTRISDGKLSIKLPVDTFLVIIEEVYHNTVDNTLIVEQGVILGRDFKFWKCTSF
jgi:hypothetical protein